MSSKLVVLAVLALSVGATACSDDDDDAAATTTTVDADAALCTDRAALGDAVGQLRDVNLVAEGTSGLREALSGVEEQLQQLAESAGDRFQPEVEALRDAIGELREAVTTSAGMAAIGTALGGVASSGSALLQSLESVDCS